MAKKEMGMTHMGMEHENDPGETRIREIGTGRSGNDRDGRDACPPNERERMISAPYIKNSKLVTCNQKSINW